MFPQRAIARSALASVLAFTACDSPPPADGLPEWTAADHDQAEQSARAATQSPGTPGAKGGPKGPDPLVEATWSQQCATCHGPMGRGDGPTGPMVHAADLTQAAWQSTVTDADLAKSIVSGKGKMPSFADLPPKVVTGLVARIRALRGR